MKIPYWNQIVHTPMHVLYISVLFISGKCKRFPRHLLFLLWFSWRFKIAEVNGNRAEQGSIYFCKHLHDKLLWPIGGVECVYTSQLNGTGIYEPCPAGGKSELRVISPPARVKTYAVYFYSLYSLWNFYFWRKQIHWTNRSSDLAHSY